MREELLLKYLAELQRHQENSVHFAKRIERVCDQIEKELGIESSLTGCIQFNDPYRDAAHMNNTHVSPSSTGFGSTNGLKPNRAKIGNIVYCTRCDAVVTHKDCGCVVK